jgi:hypothetical protein
VSVLIASTQKPTDYCAKHQSNFRRERNVSRQANEDAEYQPRYCADCDRCSGAHRSLMLSGVGVSILSDRATYLCRGD